MTGYISDSFGLADKLADYLWDKSSSITEKFDLSKFGAVANVISSVTGFGKDLIRAIEKVSSTTGDPTENFADGIEKFVGSFGSLAESVVSGKELKAVMDAIKTSSTDAIGKVKDTFKSAQSWLTLGNTILDTAGSGISTTMKLASDGRFSGKDMGEVGFTSAIHGLDTLISGATFGIISSETLFGKNVDKVVDDVKSWASNLSNNASSYILRDPNRLEEYNEAGPIKQAGMILWATIAGNTKENRVCELDQNIAPNSGFFGLFEEKSSVPTMSPVGVS